MVSEENKKLRLDKWLWAARFFKTRRLAIDAVKSGKVQLNGYGCKPSKEVEIGNTLHIHKHPYSWDIEVLGVNAQRRPAREAILLYQETPESHEKRQLEVAKRREEKSFNPTFDQRPNKKQRRQIHQFKSSD